MLSSFSYSFSVCAFVRMVSVFLSLFSVLLLFCTPITERASSNKNPSQSQQIIDLPQRSPSFKATLHPGTTGLNVRSEPSRKGTVIGIIHPKQSFHILGAEEKGWIRVLIPDLEEIGWAYVSYILKGEPSAKGPFLEDFITEKIREEEGAAAKQEPSQNESLHGEPKGSAVPNSSLGVGRAHIGREDRAQEGHDENATKRKLPPAFSPSEISSSPSIRGTGDLPVPSYEREGDSETSSGDVFIGLGFIGKDTSHLSFVQLGMWSSEAAKFIPIPHSTTFQGGPELFLIDMGQVVGNGFFDTQKRTMDKHCKGERLSSTRSSLFPAIVKRFSALFSERPVLVVDKAFTRNLAGHRNLWPSERLAFMNILVAKDEPERGASHQWTHSGGMVLYPPHYRRTSQSAVIVWGIMAEKEKDSPLSHKFFIGGLSQPQEPHEDSSLHESRSFLHEYEIVPNQMLRHELVGAIQAVVLDEERLMIWFLAPSSSGHFVFDVYGFLFSNGIWDRIAHFPLDICYSFFY